MATMTRPVPGHCEADVVLRDGSTVRIRPVRREDAGGLLDFLHALSEESRHARYFHSTTDAFLREEAAREAVLDDGRRYGLVAVREAEQRIVGHAMFAARTDHAEVAFTIADDYQGRGLATTLLLQLAEVAAARGIHVFEALVLPDNHRMIEVFRESGFPVEVKAAAGELRVAFPTEFTAEARERFERREQIAAANALRAFFAPRTVAVIGASRRRGTIGGEIFHNLRDYGFAGPIYPVNPAATVVQSSPAYASVEDIPGPVDLGVIAVPAGEVLAAAEACARKGTKGLVVISAGFAETGEAGRARQAELLRICRSAGMRLIGPNCMGIVNTDPAVRLNATFAPAPPPAGRVGFFSQSGALGLAIIDYAATLGLGLSTFVSIGNKADLSGNDLLRYWESDPQTDVILLYLESFGNPRNFSRIARRVGREKPIVVVKSGRSAAGARATTSHTGALLAASDATVEALFRQAGVIRTDTLAQLFDVALLLANQAPPTGRRVGIVTNAGGPGILCADACEAEGLEVPVLSEETQRRLRGLLPAEAGVANPVDMLASAPGEHIRKSIQIVAADPSVDALIVIFIPPLVTPPEEAAAAIVEGVRGAGSAKSVMTVFMSARGVPPELKAPDVHIPSFAFPEDAALALAKVARYGEWRRRPVPPAESLDGLRRDEAAAVVARVLSHGGGWLTPEEIQQLFSCYGLPMPAQRIVAEPEDAARAAVEIGGPVALKAIAAGLVHKTELGAVRLELTGGAPVRAAAEEMASRLAVAGHRPDGFIVQRMVSPGVEMLVGVAADRQFGPVVACGAGGVMVEVLQDVAVRLSPISGQDAEEMLRGLKTYPLLRGFRGAPPADVSALIEVLLRVSALAEDIPEVAELDCNPVVVGEWGATVVDARVRISAVEPAPPLGARR